ncbi:glycosyltransferase family 4 protein [Solibacillus sp. FSL W8-0474]|uniref:glycosyltransferase family 4 protein n=1 Tax=Solibacillus sp. FSL W8-0474 TaxID=2975336 RepID=UPI0030F9F8A8
MKILVLANFGMGLYNFRKELLEELIRQQHEVYISLPNDEYVPKLEKIGCKFVDTQLDRRGTNPLRDFSLFVNYIKTIREIRPSIVLTYTIKPNVYGGIACAITKIPYITNITGLGTSLENESLIQRITLVLYKLGLNKASTVFFQNRTNQIFFENKVIANNKTKLIPGSGVNIEQYSLKSYPVDNKEIQFLFIGRIMKAKGIDELFEAAKIIKAQYPNANFHLVGGMEENYEEKLNELQKQDIIKYHGQQGNVSTFIKESHAIILPSHHEGLANVLLESAATGRPVLASKVPGCIETFDDGVSGFGFEVKNVESLVKAILKFINLPYEKKIEMGIAGRKKMEKEFDRNFVVKAYINEIRTAISEENHNESI